MSSDLRTIQYHVITLERDLFLLLSTALASKKILQYDMLLGNPHF
jgi:hypothetical protein